MNLQTKSEQVAMDYRVAARIPYQIWDFARFVISLLFDRVANHQNTSCKSSRHVLSLLFEVRKSSIWPIYYMGHIIHVYNTYMYAAILYHVLYAV